MVEQTKTRLVAGPFNRVEGDLEVRLDVVGHQVERAWVNAPLFRGIERVLEGRTPMDALVIAPRICGICSVSQSHAAALALGGVMGMVPTHNGQLATNLILATENLADHLTHFHLFFMPDFARPDYEGRPWHPRAYERFAALRGSAVRGILQTRALALHVMGILAGHWPHTLAIQPGGLSRGVEKQECTRLLGILGGVRAALEDSLFGTRLEDVAALSAPQDLRHWRDKQNGSDFGLFLQIAQDLALQHSGRSYDRFLSFGAYPGFESDPRQRHWRSGIFESGAVRALNIQEVREDHTFSHMAQAPQPLPPFEGTTEPHMREDASYTWCKAPRMAGLPCETGALARQLMAGQPLVRALVADHGGNVLSRVVARLVEVARLVPLMEQWVRALRPGEPWCHAQPGTVPDGRAIGMTEAARGALGHWLCVEKGLISRYQIIAPTTWNFSPRDSAGVEGPLEYALRGAPVKEGEQTPLSVQHIVRSFDPCMACTVH
ncbi:MAG: nickel-dependent hydrogenase large subunit [Acetobacter fabarum]|jgi:hydrogenase large subunit|uniref:nickel-dependent hydrogenase large subunit n=1 Tax=Acetobacter fabarum TaxID=483199 RepID=UPI00242C1729|nr:nickel-dependent hydrogenase large subunit [Acetobacter fabarum]MCH4026382.1 nickel-dependent hydrogenase large subunit [Acetobacter fabarum]MCH4055751.1 nickel-dependent hydrogenase large subunit [Acetobacter fabarum]MCH4085756.1 nickel-dependent hydrogenase large subunit [Acetobacter fabarum]MCH4128278.1 nickel-dependent hydrogenase large subunit [Acetobacter fabarum]MCH4137001.1 nickel-dependent hydrogenase large subunit [Acetobacter fabarum]